MGEAQVKPVRQDRRTLTRPVTISVRTGDKRIAQELIEFYGPGTTMSEVYRTALRSLYTQTLGKRNA